MTTNMTRINVDNATLIIKHHLKVSQNFLLAANVRGKYLCFCLPFKSFPACNKAPYTWLMLSTWQFTSMVFPYNSMHDIKKGTTYPESERSSHVISSIFISYQHLVGKLGISYIKDDMQ